MIIWMTGLSGAGKTTLAWALHDRLEGRCFVLDGDDVRYTINRGLGFTSEDRKQNVINIANLAILIQSQTDYVIVACTSPCKRVRDEVFNFYLKKMDVKVVHVECDLETCKIRDPKGIYEKFTSNIVGDDIPYDIPDDADISIDTKNLSIPDSVKHILNLI